MKKRLMPALAFVMLPALFADAITYTYGNFNKSARTCTLMSWSGQQPSSGKLVLKETFEQDGITYKVTAVAPHALDNLTEVTEITIPANVKSIGKTRENYVASCQNFNNCPKLKIFKVASGSADFRVSGAGILMKKTSNVIARVPENLEVADGVLKMSTSVVDICPDAFAGNISISILALAPHMFTLSGNCGFNYMPNLKEFRINGSSTDAYSIKDGILYNPTGTELLSFPPGRTDTSFTVPDGVQTIGIEAFANTRNLFEIDFGSVTRIRKKAFYNCGMSRLELPNREIKLDEGVFSHSQKLTEIVIPFRTDIPADFARASGNLRKVYVHSSLSTFGDCAFKDCSSLDNFNFNPSLTFDGDSVFAGCNFKQIEWAAGAVGADGLSMGYAMFDKNRSLTRLDFSRLTMYEGNGSLGISPMFVSGCENLREVVLPRRTVFRSSGMAGYPNFGINPVITRLEIGVFRILGRDMPPIVYNNGFSINPAIFVKTTDALEKSWPLNRLISVTGGSVVKPSVFCEAYSMQDAESGNKEEYVIKGADYFVPGGTFNNYVDAMRHGCKVTEMFDISFGNENGGFNVGVHALIGDGIVFKSLTINNEWSCVPDADGRFVTDYDINDVDKYDLYYEVNGVSFKTSYPKPMISAVEGVAGAGTVISGGMIFFGSGTADYAVFDMSGKPMLKGQGNSADLTSLDKGVYLIYITFPDGKVITKKIAR